ncbi:MAG: EcsC family protein [Firmicutes bacterium]|nr:EcsC family protein [Bacillota bacterium]
MKEKKVSLLNRKSAWERDWEDLKKKEAKYQEKRNQGPTSVLLEKLDRFIPKKLNDTLDLAFSKAFALIFEKGTGVIEKTYNKEQKQADFLVDAYATEIKADKKSVKRFTKRAKASKAANLMITGVEGIGLGLVGAGLPDIPLFVAMVLKSVYEVALSYGYDYESDGEKAFILKVIETSMYDGEEFIEENRRLNELIEDIVYDGDTLEGYEIDKEVQIEKTAKALSKEMLYTKFLQGQMIVGVAGGIFNPIYINRITDYAVLKYRRRFLTSKVSSQPSSL